MSTGCFYSPERKIGWHNVTAAMQMMRVGRVGEGDDVPEAEVRWGGGGEWGSLREHRWGFH